VQGGEDGEDTVQLRLVDVEHESDLLLGGEDALQQQGQAVDLAPFELVLVGVLVGDEAGGGLAEGVDDAQLVGAQAGAGFGDLDDGIG